MVFLFILLAFTVARVTRFITSDDLIGEPRDAILTWLNEHGRDDADQTWEPPLWRRKLASLIDCPYCVSIWVAGATFVVLYWIVDYDLPLPLFWWPAMSMAAVAILEWTDGQRDVKVTLSDVRRRQ